MSKTLMAGMLALNLAACTGGAVNAGDATGSDSASKESAAGDTASAAAKQQGAIHTERRERTISTQRTVANGTEVRATIQDSLSSRINKPGETLTAIVSADVNDASGSVLVPAGSTVVLSVLQLEPGSDQVRPEGRLSLEVNSLRMGGRSYPVTATLGPVAHHLQARGMTRDVIVAAGTPVVLTLTQPLNFSTR